MPIIVYPSSPRRAAHYWLAGSPVVRVPKQANLNTIASLMRRGLPVYKIKGIANKIVATERKSLANAIRRNIGRRRAETILTSRAGLFNTPLSLNVIRSISKHVTARRR